jgi:hypothetical protein
LTTFKNSVVIGGVTYVRIPNVRTKDFVNTSLPARVLFTRDPETQSDYYYRQSYRRPTQILSEDIQSDIPPPYDDDTLIPATALLIEGVQNGNYTDAREYIRNVLKKNLWKQIDGGDQGYQDIEPVSREF